MTILYLGIFFLFFLLINIQNLLFFTDSLHKIFSINALYNFKKTVFLLLFNSKPQINAFKNPQYSNKPIALFNYDLYILLFYYKKI